jgi:hypothetical protein
MLPRLRAGPGDDVSIRRLHRLRQAVLDGSPGFRMHALPCNGSRLVFKASPADLFSPCFLYYFSLIPCFHNFPLIPSLFFSPPRKELS